MDVDDCQLGDGPVRTAQHVYPASHFGGKS